MPTGLGVHKLLDVGFDGFHPHALGVQVPARHLAQGDRLPLTVPIDELN
jgi:lysophospholipase L1-like esterase